MLPAGDRRLGDGRVSSMPSPAAQRRLAAVLLFLGAGPAVAVVFFAIPLDQPWLNVSLQTGDARDGLPFTWAVQHLHGRDLSDYDEQFIRSFVYAGLATVLCLLIGYPARILDRLPGRPLART